MSGTYEEVTEGLVERIDTIPTLTGKVYDFEPTSIDPPMCYLLLDHYERTLAGTVRVMKYFTLARICVRWQDNEQAEAELRAYVNSLGAALDADPKLGGRVGIGPGVTAISGPAVFVIIGGTLYRALDSLIETVVKFEFGSGI